LILLAQPRFFRLQRHILRPEQLDLDLGIPVEDLVAFFGQLRANRMGYKGLGELELARLELRLDMLHEMQVGLFRLGIVGVTRHGDIALGRLLIYGGAQLAPSQQPLFQLGGGGASFGASFKLVEERSNLIPVSQVNPLGHKSAGFVRRQRAKWQSFHARKIPYDGALETGIREANATAVSSGWLNEGLPPAHQL